MILDEVTMLFDYDRWANRRLWTYHLVRTGQMA